MKNDKILDDIISMLGKFKKSLSQLSKTEVKEQWGQINKRIEELVQSQKQNMKKEEHLEIINRLMPGIVQAAEEQNGLVPPDLETWTVLFRTLSVGFAMGRYFERTDPKSSMEERFASMISQAEQIRSDEF